MRNWDGWKEKLLCRILFVAINSCFNVTVMIFSMKRIKQLVIILALVVINAWFWGNAALQFTIYRLFSPMYFKGSVLDQVPDKIELPESDIESENLHFFGFSIKMSFLKDARDAKLNHGYMLGQLQNISLLIYKDDRLDVSVRIEELAPFFHEDIEIKTEESSLDKLWKTVSPGPVNYMETRKLTHYARLSDLSWWNLCGNFRLLPYLVLKSISMHSFAGGYYSVYDIETPYIKGYLVESDAGRMINESFDFELDNRSYNIDIMSRNGAYGLRNLIGSIKPDKSVEKSYNDMSALRKNNPGYPEELLLLSEISIKGPVEADQKEYILKGLEEQLGYALSSSNDERDKGYVEKLRKEITNLKASMGTEP